MKKEEQEILHVRVPKDLKNSVISYATKTDGGISKSEATRQLIEKGLAIEKTTEDMDFIRSNIRAELESYLAPQVNRLVKLIVKSGITSAAGYFLNAKALAELVPAHLREELEKVLKESKKQGVAYIQVKDSKIDDAITEMTNNK